MSSSQTLPDFGDRYTALSEIGAGGMGRVYLAHDARHDRRVAVKVLDPDYARLVGPERFLREIRILAGLTHPNIVPLHDSGEVDGQLFYVMPYLEGESLRRRLDREGSLPLADVLTWASEIGEALAFAHGHGIIHRDIKPENILLHAGRALLVDFGIARAVDLATGDSLTSQQIVIGTSLYMSPEQATASAGLDARTDLYSFACVIYEMLAGEPPFRSPNITAKKLAGSYPRLRVVRPTVPEAVERVLARTLAPSPADRYATADELCKALRAAAKPTSQRIVPWVASIILVGGAVVLAVTFGSDGTPATEVRRRVVVGIFENRTGDPRYDPLGFMAADWVTEGLQRTGAVEVVPTATALAASRFVREHAGDDDPVRALGRETGANLVVNGSIYRDQDTLVLQAQLVNADSSRLVGAVEPIRTAETKATEALMQLRGRLMGLLALSLDDRVLQGERPPTYAAYQAFSEGIDAYVRNDYRVSLEAFQRAYAADTTFVLPLLYAGISHSNQGDYAAADSLLRIVGRQRNRLNPHDRYLLDYQAAELAGRDSDALIAIRRAAELAPTSKAAYNFAARAYEAREPVPAESALRRLSPDVGPMRGWLPYWEVLTSALHAQREHGQELKAAREARRRYPERVSAHAMEGRALAAQRQDAELERLWLELPARVSALGGAQLGVFAYEIASELRAHGDSAGAQKWFARSHEAFVAGGDASSTTESRWGRARSAADLGRWREALVLCEALVAADSTRVDYLGLLGISAAQLGDRERAGRLVEHLAGNTRPYTFGRPQYQAARIASALGQIDRAAELLGMARARGYPYNLALHRDPLWAPLSGRPIMREMDARRR